MENSCWGGNIARILRNECTGHIVNHNYVYEKKTYRVDKKFGILTGHILQNISNIQLLILAKLLSL